MLIILVFWLMLESTVVAREHGLDGQLYSSLDRMNDLFRLDDMIGEILPYIPLGLPETERYREGWSCLLRDSALLAKGASRDAAGASGNPLHLYSLIKRLVLYWPSIHRSIVTAAMRANCTDTHPRCEMWASRSECLYNPSYMLIYCQAACGLCGKPELKKLYGSLESLWRETLCPTENDLRGASLALARLQRIYQIPITDMAAGIIANVQTCVTLSTYDILQIANETYREGEYASAWQWYHFAVTSTDDLDFKAYITKLRDEVAMAHDEGFDRRTYNELQKYFPQKLSTNMFQVPHDDDFNKLCRGMTLLDAETSSSFKCYLSSRGSPYLTLRPIKCEHVHDDPEMYVFYDVISDEEIRAIQATARDKLARSGAGKYTGPSEVRVSHTGWLMESNHPVLPVISRRISEVAGLHVYEGAAHFIAAELLQVLSYGIGGHYVYHHDPLWTVVGEEPNYNLTDVSSLESGDRLATWLFYLSDVEAGGRTAFPKAGVSVKPVKGSAVMWFNLRRNGRLNDHSLHGGCPVLLGHKWVANKWIREAANFLRRPCSLNRYE